MTSTLIFVLHRRLVLAIVFLTAASAGAQCPPAVQPTTPANGLVTTETHVNFAWSPAGSAVTGYDLFLSANGGAFQTICLASPSPNCSATLTTGRYEWFVRNYRDDCQRGTESAHFRFEVAACSAPVAPPTLTPDGGFEVPASGTTLTWSGGSADSYDVFLEQGSACATTTALGRTAGTSISSGPLVRGATYAWRVRASRGSTCPAPVFSHCATFKVRPCDPPAAFALTSPGNGGVSPSTTKLQWTAAAGATSYNVYANSALIGTTTGTSMYAVFPPSASVEWYVDAYVDANRGACLTTTAHRTFTIASCDVGTATLLAPTGTLTPGSAINFRWSSARNAELYRVWLAPSGGTFAPIDETVDTTTNAHRPPGGYDWYVEATGRGCPSTTSATGHFVVPKANACPNPPSSLTATGAGDVTFNWSGNASRYELWASVNHSAAARLATTAATSYTTDLAAGAIEWFVIAKADGCDDARSATASFTKQNACDNGVPLLLAPAGGAQRIPTGVDFFWTNVAGASTYRLWSAVDEGAYAVLATTTATRAHADVPAGRIRWFVEAVTPNCGSSRTPEDWFRAVASTGCALPDAPAISAPAGVPSGTTFELHWTPLPNIDHYEIQRDATVLSTKDVMLAEKFDVASATSIHYRVRGVSSCGAGTGPFSNELVVTVTPNGTSVPYGTAEVLRTLFVPGAGANVRFTATADRPWIVIEPASGILPPAGITLTLRFLASQLDAGDHQASIRIDTVAAGKTGISNGSTSTPISVSVVTPVTPAAATSATPSSLILPAVAHLDAATSFHSDMRLLNSGARPLRYLLTYVAAGTDGTKSAQSTSVQVNGGASIALNDLLASFFGTGNSFGSLEIRPLTAAGDLAPPGDVTFASSRTYALTALGTAGQFIPALPLAKFGSNTTQLLAQVTQHGAFRTNVGLVEGGAQNATVVLHFFNKNGFELGGGSYDLPPRGLLQLDSLIKSDSFLADVARIEVASSGRVTAYASILDQATNDPMLIQAVPLPSIGATRYVVPGVAALVSSGGQWRSDLQIDNLSSLPQNLNVSFVPRDNPEAGRSAALTLKEKEVRTFVDILRTLFDETSASGSAIVTTSDFKSQLAVTTRTYFDNGSGTYGQFIPALTADDGAILGGRAREVLQVEQSDRYRTNLGLVELTGAAAATVEIIANVPELKSAPVIALTLKPNEFRQLDSILASLGFTDVHNARLSIRVIGGAGRVGAYASLVDSLTGDPTLIPAQ